MSVVKYVRHVLVLLEEIEILSRYNMTNRRPVGPIEGKLMQNLGFA